MAANKITILTDKDRDYLKSKSPAVLPDNPSGKGWTASQIKMKFYEGLLLIFEWMRTYQKETTDMFNEVQKITLNQISDYCLRFIDGSAIVSKAKADADGNSIKATYASKYELEKLSESFQSGERGVTSYFNKSGSRRSISEIEDNITSLRNDITNGTLVADKAIKDNQGNSIVDTYVKYELISQNASSSGDSIPTLSIVKNIVNNLSRAFVNADGTTIQTIAQLAEVINSNEDIVANINSAITLKANANDVYTKTETYSKNESDAVKATADSALEKATALETAVGNIDSILDSINGEVI